MDHGSSTPAVATDSPGPALLERLAGGPVEYRFSRTVPTAITEATIARVLARVRGVVGSPGSVSDVADRLDWRTDGGFDRLSLTVEPRTDETGTAIRLRGDRSVAAMLVLALAIGGWVIAFGASVAALYPATTTELAALGIGYLLAALAAARTVWSRTGRRFARLFAALAEEVTLEVTAPDGG